MTVAQVSNFDPFDPPAAENADEMTRLVRALRLTDRFAIFVVTCNRADLRDQLIDEVRAANPERRFEEIVVSRSVTSLLPALAELPVTNETPGAVFVYGLESFLADTEDVTHSSFVANLNRARDSFPEYLSCPLVLWLPDYVRNGVMQGAPDFYSVRSASFVFHAPFPHIETILKVAQAAQLDAVRDMKPTERDDHQREIQDLINQIKSVRDVDQDFSLLSGLFDRLSGFYAVAGNYADAELLLRRVVAMDTRVLGTEHHDRATDLNNLAYVLKMQGKFVDAAGLFREAYRIHRSTLGETDPEVGTDLSNLASLLYAEGKFLESEGFFNQSAAIFAKTLGREDPRTLSVLGNLSQAILAQGRLGEAKRIAIEVLQAQERILGTSHSAVATSLNNLAIVFWIGDKLAEAESLLLRAITIEEKIHGDEHPEIAKTLFNLATVLQRQGRLLQAEAAFARALTISECMLGPDDPSTTRVRAAYEALRRQEIPVNSPNVFASTIQPKRVLTPLALPRVRGKRKSGKAKK